MSKGGSSGPPPPPGFTPSETMYGNDVVGKTYKGPDGSIVNQYLPTPGEQQMRDTATNQLNQVLSGLTQTSPEMSKQMDDMANAYTTQAQQTFMNQFNPMLRQIREDIGSRFGTLQATPYMDQLQNVGQNIYNPAMQQIAEQGQSMKNDLYNQDLNRKIQEIQGLSYPLNMGQQNFMQGLQQPLAASTTANQFNQNNYNSQIQQYEDALNRNQQMTGSVLGGLATLGAAAIPHG